MLSYHFHNSGKSSRPFDFDGSPVLHLSRSPKSLSFRIFPLGKGWIRFSQRGGRICLPSYPIFISATLFIFVAVCRRIKIEPKLMDFVGEVFPDKESLSGLLQAWPSSLCSCLCDVLKRGVMNLKLEINVKQDYSQSLEAETWEWSCYWYSPWECFPSNPWDFRSWFSSVLCSFWLCVSNAFLCLP